VDQAKNARTSPRSRRRVSGILQAWRIPPAGQPRIINARLLGAEKGNWEPKTKSTFYSGKNAKDRGVWKKVKIPPSFS
jgi:hypothetical protein